MRLFYVWGALLTLFGCTATSDFSGGSIGALTCSGGPAIKIKAVSKREYLMGKEFKKSMILDSLIDLSRGIGCDCSRLICGFRATVLTTPLYLAKEAGYDRSFEVIQKGYETNPKILADLKNDMADKETKAKQKVSQSTCFNIVIVSTDEDAIKRKNWDMFLTADDGVKQRLTLAMIQKVDLTPTERQAAGKLNAYTSTACSPKAIDFNKSFSLHVNTTIKDTPKPEFTLEWEQGSLMQ